MLNWYRTLLHLRHANGALRNGAYVPLESGNPDVLAYARRDAAGNGVLVLLNMSAQAQAATITGWGGKAPRGGKVLLAGPNGFVADLQHPRLAPYAAALVAFSRR